MNEGYSPKSEKMQKPQMKALGLDPYAMQEIDESFLECEMKIKSLVLYNALLAEENEARQNETKTLKNIINRLSSLLSKDTDEDPE